MMDKKTLESVGKFRASNSCTICGGPGIYKVDGRRYCRKCTEECRMAVKDRQIELAMKKEWIEQEYQDLISILKTIGE